MTSTRKYERKRSEKKKMRTLKKYKGGINNIYELINNFNKTTLINNTLSYEKNENISQYFFNLFEKNHENIQQEINKINNTNNYEYKSNSKEYIKKLYLNIFEKLYNINKEINLYVITKEAEKILLHIVSNKKHNNLNDFYKKYIIKKKNLFTSSEYQTIAEYYYDLILKFLETNDDDNNLENIKNEIIEIINNLIELNQVETSIIKDINNTIGVSNLSVSISENTTTYLNEFLSILNNKSLCVHSLVKSISYRSVHTIVNKKKDTTKSNVHTEGSEVNNSTVVTLNEGHNKWLMRDELV
jgi:hypothetical protein